MRESARFIEKNTTEYAEISRLEIEIQKIQKKTNLKTTELNEKKKKPEKFAKNS